MDSPSTIAMRDARRYHGFSVPVMSDAMSPLSAVRRALGVRPPDQGRPLWHISPIIDVLAYHLSWVFLLVPLVLFFGSSRRDDYLLLYAAVGTLTVVHQHATLSMVALDRRFFRHSPVPVAPIALVLLAAFLATPTVYATVLQPLAWSAVHLGAIGAGILLILQLAVAGLSGHSQGATALFGSSVALLVAGLAGLGPWSWLVALTLSSALLGWDRREPSAFMTPALIALGSLGLWLAPTASEGLFPPRRTSLATVVMAVALLAAIWNVWHTFMQKYGILRMYAAKSGLSLEDRTPGWVDRLLVFGWLPLIIVWLGPDVRELIIGQRVHEAAALVPIFEAIEGLLPFLLVPAAGLASAAAGAFLYWEYKGAQFRNPARLSMGLAMIALNTAFLVVDPIKVFVAYAFSHAIEYLVFVWAYQRRHYVEALEHHPPLGPIVRKYHGLYWLGLFGFVGGGYFYGYYSDDFFLEERLRLFGTELWLWIYAWGVYVSIAHFFLDGFLWKIRRPTLRENL